MTFKKGGWVARNDTIGKIKDVHEYDDELLLDIVLYSHDGTKIGRESPAGDGPKKFEPCCESSLWRSIEKPEFPIKFSFYPNEKFVYLDDINTKNIKNYIECPCHNCETVNDILAGKDYDCGCDMGPTYDCNECPRYSKCPALEHLEECPMCKSDTGVKYPRTEGPYCEDCGWPFECRE